jgi:FkbM family methyltransferase
MPNETSQDTGTPKEPRRPADVAWDRDSLSKILLTGFPDWKSLYAGREGEFAVMGAGQLGSRIVARAISRGTEPKCIIDNDPYLWGTGALRSGVRVVSPQQAFNEFGDIPIVVAIANVSGGFLSVRDQLLEIGFKTVLPVQAALWRYPDLLPNYYLGSPIEFQRHRVRILSAYDALDDDLSRETFVRFVRCRHLLDYDALPNPLPIYPDDILPKNKPEIIADCGAYDGDTLTMLSQMFPRASLLIGIEPDPVSYARLLEWKSLQTIPVQCFNVAVSNKDEQVAFVQTTQHDSSIQSLRTGSPANATGLTQCRRLDSLFTRFIPTIVKMDIEGAEMAALNGATSMIAKAQTKWCITTEHRQSDLWEIPLFFNRFKDKYTIHLRSHGIEGVDLICYAIPR